MTTVFLDAHKVPLDPYTAASGMGLHTDQHGGAKVSHIGCWCCDRNRPKSGCGNRRQSLSLRATLVGTCRLSYTAETVGRWSNMLHTFLYHMANGQNQ